MNTLERRRELVKNWIKNLNNAALDGKIVDGKQVVISRVSMIAGPRAGVIKLKLELGGANDKMFRSLKVSDHSKLRKTIPEGWAFTKTSIFMEGRFIRCEADWPPELADTKVTLDRIGQHPKGVGSWVAGISETSNTVVPCLCDETPAYLVTGSPGAGKSMAVQAAVLQLSQERRKDNSLANEFVLIDGKYGKGLEKVAYVPGIIGPLAKTPDEGRAAISWAVKEMQRRYNGTENSTRLILVIDEIQPFFQDGGPIASMLQTYISQGREVGCYAILATWYPIRRVFGDRTTMPLIDGKIALYMKGYEASRVVIGDSWPRTGDLGKPGDAYCIRPNTLHRAQLVCLTPKDYKAIPISAPKLKDWPPFDPEAAGTLDDDKQVNWGYTGGELGCSVLAAANGNGRRNLTNKLNEEGFEAVEGDRVKRLSTLGKEAYQWLQSRGWALKRTNGGGLAGGLPAKNTPPDAWDAYFASFETVN